MNEITNRDSEPQPVPENSKTGQEIKRHWSLIKGTIERMNKENFDGNRDLLSDYFYGNSRIVQCEEDSNDLDVNEEDC